MSNKQLMRNQVTVLIKLAVAPSPIPGLHGYTVCNRACQEDGAEDRTVITIALLWREQTQ